MSPELVPSEHTCNTAELASGPVRAHDSHVSAPHVVILGGGFGGLAVARGLANAPVTVTLVDRRNHHLFQPLLYQVATAALNPSDIAYPIRSVLAAQKNARVLLAEARSIDVAQRRIALDGGELHYDILVVATGATHSYFGKPWATYAPGLKSIEDALEIRRRVFLAYEAAERAADPTLQRALLTFVVVGGGPTGVELAGALGEIGLQTLAHDFRRIDSRQVKVVLVEGKDRILPAYPPKLSAAAAAALASRHVEVATGSMVTRIDDRGIAFRRDSDEERIEAGTVLWAAGVQASPLAAMLGVATDRAGRVEVGPDLTVAGHSDVFAIGDMARVVVAGNEVPGVAQGALQAGRYVARVIAAQAVATRRGQAPPVRRPFRYRDKGSMAAIGRAQAIVHKGAFAHSGFFAWLLWWVVHIAAMVGFRNRLIVMFEWAWSWATFSRGARLITGDVGPLPPVIDVADDGTLATPGAGLVQDGRVRSSSGST